MKRPEKREILKRTIFYSIFMLALVSIRSSVFASYIVPTPSMNPTILEGDIFYTNKLAYRLKVPLTDRTLIEWDRPSRGDIIVFKFPLDESELYTKRVIGVAGDVVEVSGGRIFLNGAPIQRTPKGSVGKRLLFEEELPGTRYTIQKLPGRPSITSMRRTVVPEGHLFVCGDNRDNSYDSRSWGFLPVDKVEGEITVRWFSIDLESWMPRPGRIGRV